MYRFIGQRGAVFGLGLDVPYTDSYKRTGTASVLPKAPDCGSGKGVQQILNDLGYAAGSVDGAFGKNTFGALARFASDKGVSYQANTYPTANLCSALMLAWQTHLAASQSVTPPGAGIVAAASTPSSDVPVPVTNYTASPAGTVGPDGATTAALVPSGGASIVQKAKDWWAAASSTNKAMVVGGLGLAVVLLASMSLKAPVGKPMTANRRRRYRSNRVGHLTKAQVVRMFREEVLPSVRTQYGRGDRPAESQAWNDFTDGLQKDGQISARQYHQWTNPMPNGRRCRRNATSDGFHVMKYGGGRYTSVAWYATKGEAEREVKRLSGAGLWSGMPPKVEPGRALGGRYARNGCGCRAPASVGTMVANGNVALTGRQMKVLERIYYHGEEPSADERKTYLFLMRKGLIERGPHAKSGGRVYNVSHKGLGFVPYRNNASSGRYIHVSWKPSSHSARHSTIVHKSNVAQLKRQLKADGATRVRVVRTAQKPDTHFTRNAGRKSQWTRVTATYPDGDRVSHLGRAVGTDRFVAELRRKGCRNIRVAVSATGPTRFTRNARTCSLCGGRGYRTIPGGMHGGQVFDRWCTCSKGKKGRSAAIDRDDRKMGRGKYARNGGPPGHMHRITWKYWTGQAGSTQIPEDMLKELVHRLRAKGATDIRVSGNFGESLMEGAYRSNAGTNLRSLGLKMHHWHSGMGDPIYAVGSYFVLGKDYPDAGRVDAALDEIERLESHLGTHAESRDRRELRSIAAGLRRYLTSHVGATPNRRRRQR